MSERPTSGIQHNRLRSLFKELVDIYSPSGKEEEILDFTYGYLNRSGLPVNKQQVDENRFNLIVFPDGQDEVDICFVGHLDTVTAYDLDNYGFAQEEDRITGLGTADMKSGCAAMIEAFTALAEREGAFPPAGLALVVDEEEDNSGASALVEEYTFPWAVIGEPTNLVPCLGHFGYLEVYLRTEGKRAHSAMPELGHNAIEGMLHFLLSVTKYLASVGGLVYNVREMTGYPGGFVVPDVCEAWVDVHFSPNTRVHAIKTALEQLAAAAKESLPASNTQLRFEGTNSGYTISKGRPLVKKLEKIFADMSLPWSPQDFRSDSDGNVLWAAGVDPIILGPGRLEEAHTPEESVLFQQVVKAAEVYYKFALSL